MESREFYESVLDYVEQTGEIITDLRKEAGEKKPAFSDDALKKTASTLVEADLLSADSAELLAQSFRDNPDKALESLCKVAGQRVQESVNPSRMIGEPTDISKESKHTGTNKAERESDRQFLESFGLC